MVFHWTWCQTLGETGTWPPKWGNTVREFAHTRVLHYGSTLWVRGVGRSSERGWLGVRLHYLPVPEGSGRRSDLMPLMTQTASHTSRTPYGGLFIVFTTVMSCAQQYQHSERKKQTHEHVNKHRCGNLEPRAPNTQRKSRAGCHSYVYNRMPHVPCL